MAPRMYTDMSLRWHSGHNVYDSVEMAMELGFERVVIDYFVPSLQSGKGKKQSEKAMIPKPSEILLNEDSMKTLQSKGQKVEQLSRFTAVLQDASNTHRLGSPEVQAYDLISVQTVNEKTFQLACQSLEVDIISLNLSESLGFPLKRALVNLAVSRGIHFEILYSPALRDNNMKRNIISNSLSLINAAGGENIIISSGTEQPLELRSPHDVVNLGKLFGLSHFQAKDTISKNCRAVLKHAESRKTCKSVVSAVKSSSLAPKQQWILSSATDSTRNEDESEEEEESSTNENEDEDDDENDDLPSAPKKKKLK